MSKVIHKFQLEVTTKVQSIRVSSEAEVLHVANQDGHLTLWFLVEPRTYELTRNFYVIATGQPIEQKNLVCVGTALMGSFVWHVWEEKDFFYKGKS